MSEPTFAGMTQAQWDAAHARIDEVDRLAREMPIGPCPAWCVGPDSPEHERWSGETAGADGFEFTLTHTSGGEFAEVEQYVSRLLDGEAISDLGIVTHIDPDTRLDAAAARRAAAGLLNAADRLEEIQRQS